jgi:hypothetical protein
MGQIMLLQKKNKCLGFTCMGESFRLKKKKKLKEVHKLSSPQNMNKK